MDEHNETNPKPNEKKPQQHSNVVWYLLGFGILVLLFVTFWSGGSEEDIQWSDLLALVEATGTKQQSQPVQGDSSEESEGGSGHIFVETGSESRPREIRLSNLEK